jgi:NADH-quinone oxidoreductase subunit N
MIQAPSVSYTGISPILFVFGAALVGVLVEAFVPRAYRWRWR